MIRMKVKLLAYTPDPEKLVAAAAKNCYSSTDVDSVLDGLTEEKTESFVNMLSEIGHESPIEHVSFTFAIEGVSRSLLAQITRHRIASFSVQSQRYVREKGFEYVVPPEIDKIPAARAKFIQAMADDQRTYEELTAVLMEGYLKELLEQGVPEKTARSFLYRMRVPFMRLFDDARNRSEIVATFLAVLELSKTRRIRLEGDGEEMELMLTNDNTK